MRLGIKKPGELTPGHAPPARFELATGGLTVRCSTDWAKGECFLSSTSSNIRYYKKRVNTYSKKI